MKLNLKAILFAAIATLLSASCVEGTLELRQPELEDVDATKVELTTLVSSDAARVRPFYVFELIVASADESVVLDAKFVSDGQPLHAATYSPATFADAHKNTYVTGADGTTLTVDGVKGQVVDGNLKVTSEAGAYTVSGTVKVNVPAEDGKTTTAYYELAWAGDAVAIKFKALPTLTKLPQLLVAKSNVASGVNTVTAQFATEGVTLDKGAYAGTGAYLAVEFYSEDGYLTAGTYKASKDPKNPAAGEFVVGQDSGEGTCWWTVENGKATASKVTAGEIYVAYDSKSKAYTVDIDNGTQYGQFVGEIAALTKTDKKPGGGYTGTILPNLLSAGVQAQYTQAVIQFGTDGLAVDPTTNATTGTGTLVNLTIHAEGTDGTSPYIPTGKYDVADGTTNPFTWQETGGMDLSEYGMGFMYWGTYLSDVVDGTGTVTEIHEGTIWVGAKNGEYVINFEFGDLKFRYTGPITGLTVPADDDGGYVGEDEGAGEEEFDGVELTQFVSFTDYKTQNGINLVGMELVSDGIEVSVEEMSWGEYTWLQTTIKGSGNHLKIEFYSENGKLAPGTYTASADPSALKEGEFGIGYDYVSDWGTSIYGTTWTTYASDQIASQEKVEDGTVVVEEDGGTYTIILTSSTATARYVGPLQ